MTPKMKSSSPKYDDFYRVSLGCSEELRCATLSLGARLREEKQRFQLCVQPRQGIDRRRRGNKEVAMENDHSL